MLGSGIFLFLFKSKTKKKKSSKIYSKIIYHVIRDDWFNDFILGCLYRSNQLLSNFFLNTTQTPVKFKCVHQNFELFLSKRTQRTLWIIKLQIRMWQSCCTSWSLIYEGNSEVSACLYFSVMSLTPSSCIHNYSSYLTH